MLKNSEFVIESAVRDDLPELMQLMREFAANLGKSDKLKLTEVELGQQIFEKGHAKVLVAKIDGHAIGFALYFASFSSFEGKAAMYLEDIYVTPLFRNKGFGKAIMKALEEVCAREGYFRIEWKVLKWNQKAIDFYHRIGAELETENVTFMQPV